MFSNYNIKSYSSRSGRLHTEIGDRYQMSSKTEKRYDYRMTFMHIDIHTFTHTNTHMHIRQVQNIILYEGWTHGISLEVKIYFSRLDGLGSAGRW